jgi:hypothetical protein
MFVLPEIHDAAPESWKNGLAIRNAASTSGVCPDCGTRGRIAGPDRDGIYHVIFEHEPDCSVVSDGEAA